MNDNKWFYLLLTFSLSVPFSPPNTIPTTILSLLKTSKTVFECKQRSHIFFTTPPLSPNSTPQFLKQNKKGGRVNPGWRSPPNPTPPMPYQKPSIKKKEKKGHIFNQSIDPRGNNNHTPPDLILFISHITHTRKDRLSKLYL